MRVLALLFAAAAFAAAQTTCKIGDLPQSGTVQGTFANTDCQAFRYLQDVPDSGRAQGWVVTATARTAVYRFRLTSTQTPVRLYINDGSSTLGGSEAQSVDGVAELDIQLPPGQYLLVAVLGTNTLGSYTLSSENRAPRQCDAVALETGTDVNGTLDGSGCAVAEYLPSLADSSPVNAYKLTVPKSAIANISLTTGDFAGGLTLLDAKGRYVQQASTVAVSVAPGTYTVLAGTQDGKTGGYTIRVDLDDRRDCPVQSITPGSGRVNGELKAEGCRVMDAFDSQTDDRAVDRYQFELASPSLASVTMTSAAVDAELYLLDEKGNVVGSNDDADYTTTDSFIGTSLASGKYTIVATTHDGVPGVYAISVGTQAGRTCAVNSLNLPGAATASLTSNGCRYLDAVQPSTTSYPTSVFRLTVPRTSFVTLTSSSPSFATAIELRSAAGALLSSSSVSNQVAQLVPAGEYRVLVYSAGSTGNVGVTTTIRDAAACASTTLTADGIPVNASLTSSGCPLRELIPTPASTVPSNLFTLETDRAGKVRVSVDTTAFVSRVVIVSSDGNIAASGLVQAEADLPAGQYQVVVTTVSSTGGDYSISALRVDPPAAQ